MGRSRSQTPSPARNSSASEPSTPFNSSFDFEEVLATPNSPLDATRSRLWSPALCHESTTKKLQRSNATLKRDLDEANDQIDFLERRVTRAQMAQKQEKQQRLEAEAALNSWEAQLRLRNENMSKRIQLLQEEKELLCGELGGLKETLVSRNRELRVQRIMVGAAFKLSEDLQKWTTLERLERLVRSGEYERILALPTGMRLLEGPPPRPNDGYIEESAGERLSKTMNTVTAMGRKREDSTSPKKRIYIHEDDDCRVEEAVKREASHERNVGDVGKRPRLLRGNRIANYNVERYYDNMAL